MKVFSILIGLLIFLAAALGGLYIGASWYVGQKIEKESVNVMKQWQESAKKYSAQLTIKEYKRQIFGSEIITEIAWPKRDNEAAISTSFICETKIKHGPFLGLALGYFASESACHLDKSEDEALIPFKGATLLSENSLVNFDRSFKSKLNIKAMQNSLKMAGQGSLLWKGCSYDVAYKIKTHLMTAAGLCHGFDFLNQEGGESNQLTVGDFQITSEALIPELAKGMMQAQKSQMQIQIPDGIKVRKGNENFDLKTVTLQQNTQIDSGKILSGQIKLNVAKLTGPDLDVGPLTFDFGFERILTEAFTKDPPDEPQQILLNSLKANPQLSINKLRMEMGADYFDFNMKFKMTPVSAEDLANPMNLVKHVDVSGGVELTETFYNKALLLSIKDPEARALAGAQSAQQLQEMKQSGFIMQDGGLLKASYKFQQGDLLINDKSLGVPVEALLGNFGGLGSPPSATPPMDMPPMDMPVDPSAPVEAMPPTPPTPTPTPTSMNSRDFSLSDTPSTVPAEPKTAPVEHKPQPAPKPKSAPSNNFFRQDH